MIEESQPLRPAKPSEGNFEGMKVVQFFMGMLVLCVPFAMTANYWSANVEHVEPAEALMVASPLSSVSSISAKQSIASPTRFQASRSRAARPRALPASSNLGFLKVLGGSGGNREDVGDSNSEFFSLMANDIDGKKVNFKKYKGRVSLIVNVASQ